MGAARRGGTGAGRAGGGLSQWHPFTSHNHLRFSTEPPTFTSADVDADVLVLPGSVSFDKGGPDGSPVFRVWSGLLMGTPDPTLVLTTPDASIAVTALERLLTGDSPDE